MHAGSDWFAGPCQGIKTSVCMWKLIIHVSFLSVLSLNFGPASKISLFFSFKKCQIKNNFEIVFDMLRKLINQNKPNIKLFILEMLNIHIHVHHFMVHAEQFCEEKLWIQNIICFLKGPKFLPCATNERLQSREVQPAGQDYVPHLHDIRKPRLYVRTLPVSHYKRELSEWE